MIFNRLLSRGTITLLAAFAVIVPGGSVAGETEASTEAPNPSRPWYELGMMADPILDQTLLFYIGHTWQQSSDLGECLATGARVDPADPYSWSREWTAEADRLSLAATACLEEGHSVSAGEILLRSTNYYQAALHRFPEPTDPEVPRLAKSAVESFVRAIDLLDMPVEVVNIPYENTFLPGYFFTSERAVGPAPTLIVHQGRDGWAEHCMYIAEAAMKRGYHCLLFDGPGQGKVLRLQGLPFRHDWEKVVTPVVDYVVSRGDVDPDRIGLVGLSMGGALAPRAAAFEKRLKVCVANPGVVSWRGIVHGFIGAFDPALADLWRTDPDAFNQRIVSLAEQVYLLEWGIKDTMWKHGAADPADMMAAMEPYTNEGILDRITCKMLVMDGTADEFSQARQLYDALNCPKKYMLFTAEDSGLQHCQVGALGVSSQRMFDWLDEVL